MITKRWKKILFFTDDTYVGFSFTTHVYDHNDYACKHLLLNFYKICDNIILNIN